MVIALLLQEIVAIRLSYDVKKYPQRTRAVTEYWKSKLENAKCTEYNITIIKILKHPVTACTTKQIIPKRTQREIFLSEVNNRETIAVIEEIIQVLAPKMNRKVPTEHLSPKMNNV